MADILTDSAVESAIIPTALNIGSDTKNSRSSTWKMWVIWTKPESYIHGYTSCAWSVLQNYKWSNPTPLNHGVFLEPHIFKGKNCFLKDLKE